MNKRIVLLTIAAIYLVVIIQTAWVSDDAFITFRTIENLVHGYGLVFNVGERVQTYTHPLWLLLQTLFYLLTQLFPPPFNLNRLFFTNIFLSIGCSFITILIYIFKNTPPTKLAILGLIAFLLSKAYIDFSTSGLENALNHLLLASFSGLFLKSETDNKKSIVSLSLLAGLAMLNRLDVFLMIFPPLVYLMWKSKEKLQTGIWIGKGLLPVILWEVFSLYYYGFLFPNTAYAKLNNNIDSVILLKQGVYYFLNSLRLDPLTLAIIGSAILTALLIRKGRHIPLAAGICLYLVYVLYIGGDFMSGRYFSLPFLIAIFMLSELKFSTQQFMVSLIFLLAVGALPFLWGIERRPSYGENRENNLVFFDDHKIADERLVYSERTSLLSGLFGNSPKIVYANEVWKYMDAPMIEVEVYGALGINAYRAGPNVHTIDRNGLADPLIARMPLIDTDKWRIGHFHHFIPNGYLETLEKQKNEIEDPQIAMYYDKLSSVIKGPLWNWNRFLVIWQMNTGKYDSLLLQE